MVSESNRNRRHLRISNTHDQIHYNHESNHDYKYEYSENKCTRVRLHSNVIVLVLEYICFLSTRTHAFSK